MNVDQIKQTLLAAQSLMEEHGYKVEAAAIIACDNHHLPVSMAFVIEVLCRQAWNESQHWAKPDDQNRS